MPPRNNSRNSSAPAKPRTINRRKRKAPFTSAADPEINYLDVNTLRKFTSEGGKILSTRITYVPLTKQRALSNAIKRARYLSLMPYTVTS